MKHPVKVVFASGSDALNAALIERMREFEAGRALYVVSEFPPPEGQWIPYHPRRAFAENFSLCRAALQGRRIALAALLLEPRVPYRRMRAMALMLAPLRLLFYNENLDHFMLRPRCAGTIARHLAWRGKNLVRWQIHPGGHLYTFAWRMRHPAAWRRPLLYRLALMAGVLAGFRKTNAVTEPRPSGSGSLPDGISVVIPSRNGKVLLERLLPGLERELEGFASEIIVVDNGSSDGSAPFLDGRAEVEISPEPLSFARAVNRGIRRARFSRVLLLNNDMALEHGFFKPLLEAFGKVPDLFCATAQILFPAGERRQETGKAVMPPNSALLDFPVRCELPLEGEDLSYVLYGSGGCSLYSTAKLRQLDGAGEVFEPAYVEDLDLGYRGWLRGWPSVFVAASRVVHFHRSTTSKYYSQRDLDRVLEVNYLRFLARAIASPAVFISMWRRAIARLNLLAAGHPDAHWLDALAQARHAGQSVLRAPANAFPDELILAIGSGDVAVFPGRPASDRPMLLIASPYIPYPLSHGGAVRMYNLMRGAAQEFDQTLVAFADELAPPPRELLDICAEIVLVRRRGTHWRTSTGRPDTVEEFDSAAFRAALLLTVRKHRPGIAQLEFTQMAQYAPDCAPAKTLLVEHDITVDLYAQLLAQGEDWEVRRQWERWDRFEKTAWKQVDRVITMSEKDRAAVMGGRAVCLPNGVDLLRFQPSSEEPEPGRLLFVGSFGHLPNLLALEFFLREVWPLIQRSDATLHIIAGARSAYFRARHKDRVEVNLEQPGIELDDFVADVGPAYRRSSIVIAPLVASAGTNIKIMEAMAMGKAIVSTPAGINGLDLEAGWDVILARTGNEMATAILDLMREPERRRQLERTARATVEAKYGWDTISFRQAELYRELMDLPGPAQS